MFRFPRLASIGVPGPSNTNTFDDWLRKKWIPHGYVVTRMREWPAEWPRQERCSVFKLAGSLSESTPHVPILHRGMGIRGPETTRPKSPLFLKQSPRRPRRHAEARRLLAIRQSLRDFPFRQSAWWRTQSLSNPFLHPNSLLTGKRTGNFSNLGRLAPAPKAGNSNVIEGFESNSVGIRTGNFGSKNTEIQKKNREFRCFWDVWSIPVIAAPSRRRFSGPEPG